MVLNTAARGRPSSGSGSRGGLHHSVARNARSRRVAKRLRRTTAAVDTAAADDDEEEGDSEPPAPKRARINWTSPTHQKHLSSAVDAVQRGASVRTAAKCDRR